MDVAILVGVGHNRSNPFNDLLPCPVAKTTPLVNWQLKNAKNSSDRLFAGADSTLSHADLRHSWLCPRAVWAVGIRLWAVPGRWTAIASAEDPALGVIAISNWDAVDDAFRKLSWLSLQMQSVNLDWTGAESTALRIAPEGIPVHRCCAARCSWASELRQHRARDTALSNSTAPSSLKC